jgi:pimeloyl-ACP methyl ester carboxylesterase
VERSTPVDGFSLAYERHGAGEPALLLHGWPGDRHDYRSLVPVLGDEIDVILADLRGFGDSDRHRVNPAEGYSASAQAASLLGLLDELGVERVLVVGYDVGSRVGQALALTASDRIRGLVITPPLPGVGQRVLDESAQREYWYQSFHQLPLAEQLIDGDPGAARRYLAHFWNHWSGPAFTPDPGQLDRLAERYGRPGAFTASIGWYRAGSGTVARSLAETTPKPADRLATPTAVLWPEHDPLFPPQWSDRLEEFFADVSLSRVPGAGHFLPIEAPEVVAEAVARLAARTALV